MISGTAAAASGMFTVMRTSSEPAWASSRHCCVVAGNVRRIGVGHGLDDDGRAAADLNLADLHADCFVTFLSHVCSIVTNRDAGMLAEEHAAMKAGLNRHGRKRVIAAM